MHHKLRALNRADERFFVQEVSLDELKICEVLTEGLPVCDFVLLIGEEEDLLLRLFGGCFTS